jgi:osmotically-inducible protein OsmY
MTTPADHTHEENPEMPKRFTHLATQRRRGLLAASLVLSLGVSACAPLLVGGAVVGSVLVATDRRTSGAQLEDQGIELKAVSRVREAVSDRGNVSVVSYNRAVLLTGEVPTEADRAAVDAAIARVENVRSVLNELAVMGSSSLTARSNDAIIGTRVKAAFVDARDLAANAFKVVTARGTVYLMGRVTEREATRAAEIARATPGVNRVVRVFEILSEAELAATQPRSAGDAGTAAPAPAR